MCHGPLIQGRCHQEGFDGGSGFEGIVKGRAPCLRIRCRTKAIGIKSRPLRQCQDVSRGRIDGDHQTPLGLGRFDGLGQGGFGLGLETGVLNNICLPSMRFCFAVLKAVFERVRVTHRRTKEAVAKPILFAELYQACVEFGLRIGHEEVDENADNGALPAGIELEMPHALVESLMPKKIKLVPAWGQLQGMNLKADHSDSARLRISLLTSLDEVPAVADEVFTSDEEVLGGGDADIAVCDEDDGDATPLAQDAVLDMCVVDGLEYKGGAVKAVQWIEDFGWWAVEFETELGVDEETVEPGFWDAHSVPMGSRWRVRPEPVGPSAMPAEPPATPGTPLASSSGKSSKQKAADARAAARHLKLAARKADVERGQRVRATMQKLAGSRFRCTCGTLTSHHGGEDKKCNLYDRGGVLRHRGYPEVSAEEFEEARAFYPKKRLV